MNGHHAKPQRSADAAERRRSHEKDVVHALLFGGFAAWRVRFRTKGSYFRPTVTTRSVSN